MRAFALRLGRLVVVLVVVSFFSFLLLEFIPGDPVVYKAGFGATPEVLDQLREELGFNDPILVRYANWVGDVLQGDLGESYFTEQKTWDAIRVALPKTIELAILAQLIALGIAIPAAITSVRNPGGVVDRMTSAIAFGKYPQPTRRPASPYILEKVRSTNVPGRCSRRETSSGKSSRWTNSK